MTLREKLMHYTYDLDCCSNLKQEAITAIENIAQYMDENELLHHSRPLAIAYLALTEDVSAPMWHGRWMHEETEGGFHIWRCSRCGRGMNDNPEGIDLYCYHCGAKMDEETWCNIV